MVCDYYFRLGHFRKECRQALNVCLICGSLEHQIRVCPFEREVEDMSRAPVGKTLPQKEPIWPLT